jgi:hypothetical protein
VGQEKAKKFGVGLWHNHLNAPEQSQVIGEL